MPGGQRLDRRTGADVGNAGSLDDDVERQRAELVDAAEGDGAAVLDGLRCGVGGGGGAGRDAGLAEGVLGPVALDVEDGGQRDARHPEQLGGETAAHLPGADEADAQRAAGLLQSLLEAVA